MALNPDCNSDPRAELLDPAATIRFLLAGDAHVTFQSRRTGTRFTYRVAQLARTTNDTKPSPTGSKWLPEIARVSEPVLHFVSVLTGPDHYEYLGTIFDGRRYGHGRKSRITKDAPSAVAFDWVWRTLTGGRMHPELGVWHEGRCGKCGRRLTTPESIASGLGPVCGGRS